MLSLSPAVHSINKDFNKSLLLCFTTASVTLSGAVNTLIFTEGAMDERLEVTDF